MKTVNCKLMTIANHEGQSSFHVQTTLLVFQCCEAMGVLEYMFWEILQKLAELHSTEDVLLTPKDGIL